MNRMTTNSPKSDLPLISVVTVVFNGVDMLEQTIRSIVSQTYPNVEFIVIDGGSTDGTIDLIKKYEHKISYWTSEKDGGIYDAMNKGTAVATGEWIGFMNAGDSYFDETVLAKIFSQPIDADIVYGLTKRIFPEFQYIKKTKPIENPLARNEILPPKCVRENHSAKGEQIFLGVAECRLRIYLQNVFAKKNVSLLSHSYR